MLSSDPTLDRSCARVVAYGVALSLALASGACGDSSGGTGDSASTGGAATNASTQATAGGSATQVSASSGTDGATGGGTSGGASTTTATGADTSGAGPKFDVGPEETGGESESESETGVTPSCKVVDDMNAVPDCDETAPPDAFELDLQWSWDGPEGYGESMVITLVGNLTDDDQNGEIDLCDVPDIVVTTYAGGATSGRIYVLDGETGAEHYHTEIPLYGYMTPALGDIDNDGLPELVTVDASYNLVAFEHDGAHKWTGGAWPPNDAKFGALALADVDVDGDVEIIAGNLLFDHTGAQLQAFPDIAGVSGFGNSSAAADLDGDGDLEIILGRSAWHHDGGAYYNNAQLAAGIPTIADIDGDGQPEVLLHSGQGISILEHDGAPTTVEQRPTGAGSSNNAWHRPSCVHDFDGNGDPEIGVSAADKYGVFEPDLSWQWLANVADGTGVASGTAFDFLGDGGAEAMYADETKLFIFDEDGQILLEDLRSSRTLIEYPVVADVDNDGSAEIVVVSNMGFGGQTAPTVQVFRDIEDRWIQARRIWNQHSYHVTNVREDGTIPSPEPAHWSDLNTFRTNAQIENGGVCKPLPPG